MVEKFSEVETARKLAEKALAVGRCKAHSIFELTRPHIFSANKTLAVWQWTAKVLYYTVACCEHLPKKYRVNATLATKGAMLIT